MMFHWFKNFLADEQHFAPGLDKEITIDVGEYVEYLITETKYYRVVLPRLPIKLKQRLGALLIGVTEHRARYAANKAIRETYEKRHTPVEVDVGGEWVKGICVDFIDKPPTRLAVNVKLHNGECEIVPLSHVVLTKKGGAGDAYIGLFHVVNTCLRTSE